MSLGFTHGGLVIDSQGRIIFNTDTQNAVIVVDSDGKFIKAWGSDFKGGAHGMLLNKEGGKEFLYITHLGRHAVFKTTLEGEVVMKLDVPEQAGVYKRAGDYSPTSVAIAPNGDIYVSDGYGQHWVHRYNAKGEYLQSWGGKGSDAGKLNQPHGVWVDTRQNPPVVVIGDRLNHRLQIFTLDGKHIKFATEGFRLPGHFDQRGDDLLVGDLHSLITIVDKDYKVIVQLGDNPDEKQRGSPNPKPAQWKDGVFIAPHSARWDAQGNLYVAEYMKAGRVNKLRRVS
jgi:hypothetical protein